MERECATQMELVNVTQDTICQAIAKIALPIIMELTALTVCH